MATKKSVRRTVAKTGSAAAPKAAQKPVEIKAEKKSVDEKKSGFMGIDPIFLIGGVIVIVLIALVVVYFALGSGGKGGETGGGTGVVVSGNLPAFSEIAKGAIESLKETGKGSLTADITMQMAAQGQNVDIGMSMSSKFDSKNKKSYTAAAVSMGGIEQTTESYIIGNMSYSKMSNPYGGDDLWVKTAAGYDMWGLDNISADEMITLVGGEVIGSEVVNGKETYKVSVTPKVDKIVDYILRGQDLSSAGVTGAQMDEIIGQLTNAIKSVDIKVWVLKDSYLPIKAEGTVVLQMDVGQLYGTPDMGNLDLNVRFTATLDYDSPVDIVLPAEALGATDLSELYGSQISICGDGFCDLEEDNVTCPEDCTGSDYNLLVGNDTDEHGCKSSAGYSWCEAKAKCIRVWEEDCGSDLDLPASNGCITEGGSIRDYQGTSCCEGLGRISTSRPKITGECEFITGGVGVCSDCGNEVCEQWENKCNCPADCLKKQ